MGLIIAKVLFKKLLFDSLVAGTREGVGVVNDMELAGETSDESAGVDVSELDFGTGDS